jgi:pyridoxal phosphate-dependent aminotransferase EpsN
MHLQPLYASCQRYGAAVAEDLFRRGICLPSSSSLTIDDQLYVINHVRAAARANPLRELKQTALLCRDDSAADVRAYV